MKLSKQDLAAWFFFFSMCVCTGTLIGKYIDPMPQKAIAATPGTKPGKISYGAINVTTAAPVPIPANCHARNAWAVYNLGPNSIYCGGDSGVATTTGFPVPPNSPLSVDIVCNGATSTGFASGGVVYCIAATADQTSPNNTRYLEVQ